MGVRQGAEAPKLSGSVTFRTMVLGFCVVFFLNVCFCVFYAHLALAMSSVYAAWISWVSGVMLFVYIATVSCGKSFLGVAWAP